MVRFEEFKELMAKIFETKKLEFTSSLNLLRKKKIAVDIRILLFDFLESFVRKPSTSIEESTKAFCQNLKKWEIDPIFVFGGIEILPNENYDEGLRIFVKRFWDYRRRRFEAETLGSSEFRKEEIKRIRKLLQIHLSSKAQSFEEYQNPSIIKYFHRSKNDFMRAPQLRESQMVSLYEEGLIDAIAGNPMTFLFGDVNSVIKSFDFQNETFSFYDFSKFVKELGFEDKRDAQLLLKICMVAFELDRETNKDEAFFLKLENCKMAEILQLHRQFQDMLQSELKNKLDLLKTNFEQIKENIDNHKQIAQNLNVNEANFSQLFRLIQNPVVISVKKGVLEKLGIPDKINSSGYEFEISRLALLFCIGFFHSKLFSFFVENTDHKAIITKGYAYTLTLQQIFETKMLKNIETALSIITRNVQITNFNYKLKIFETWYNLNLKTPSQNVSYSFLYDEPNPTLASCLKEFAQKCSNKNNYVPINESSTLSQKSILERILTDLLDNLRLIDFKSRKLTYLGSVLVKFADTPLFEQLLIFISLLKVGAINTNLEPMEGQSLPPGVMNLCSCMMGIQKFKKEFVKKISNNKKYNHFFEPLPDSKVLQISMLSKLFEIACRDCVWVELADFDCYHFVHCYLLMRDSYIYSLQGSLLQLIFETKLKNYIEVLNEIFPQFPYRNSNFGGCSGVIKIWLSKYETYLKLKKSDLHEQDLIHFISSSNITKQLKLDFDVEVFLQRGKNFFDLIESFFLLVLDSKEEQVFNNTEVIIQLLKYKETFDNFFKLITSR